MASYRGHLAFSSLLGAGYGAWGWLQGMDWGPACLAAGLSGLGGLLPDLDSDSSVPVREVFGLAAAATPFLLLERVRGFEFLPEQTLVILGGVYLLVRYGARAVFNKLTVHRGMFHSLPAMVIAGLIVFLFHGNPVIAVRLYLAGGVMLGFFSHLVLDELYGGVDLLGTAPRLSRHAGSPLKLFSGSWPVTLTTYALLAGLAYLAYLEFFPDGTGPRTGAERAWKAFSGQRAVNQPSGG
jgi:hypothetical protein